MSEDKSQECERGGGVEKEGDEGGSRERKGGGEIDTGTHTHTHTHTRAHNRQDFFVIISFTRSAVPTVWTSSCHATME